VLTLLVGLLENGYKKSNQGMTAWGQLDCFLFSWLLFAHWAKSGWAWGSISYQVRRSLHLWVLLVLYLAEKRKWQEKSNQGVSLIALL